MVEKEVEPQTRLRKCVNTPLSLNAAGFNTPGLLINKICPLETPKSSRGSSLFSPGETFWNEAIQVADGLLVPTDNCDSQEKPQTLKYNSEMTKSNALGDGVFDNSLSCMDGGANQALSGGIVSTVGGLTKHGKDLAKEVSPLPVRHFDFSIEEKNLDEEISPHKKIRKCHILKDQEIQYSSLNNERVQTDFSQNIPSERNVNSNLLDKQENTLEHDAGKKKVKLLTEDSNFVTSDGKLNGLAFKNNQNSTPSSFAVVSDHLDLNYWLPSEICNIYKRRGISKLYPWQVSLYALDKSNLSYLLSLVPMI